MYKEVAVTCSEAQNGTTQPFSPQKNNYQHLFINSIISSTLSFILLNIILKVESQRAFRQFPFKT
jgi:hypothetical protein